MKLFFISLLNLVVFSNLGISQAKFIPTLGWDVSILPQYGSGPGFELSESTLEMSSLAIGMEVESQLSKKFSGSIKSSWTSKNSEIPPYGFAGFGHQFEFGYLKNSVNLNYNIGSKINVGLGVGLNILFKVRLQNEKNGTRIYYTTFKHYGLNGSAAYTWKRLRGSVNLFQGFTDTFLDGTATFKPFTSIELAVGYIIGIKLGN